MSEHKHGHTYPKLMFHKFEKAEDGSPRSVKVCTHSEASCLPREDWVHDVKDVPGYVAKVESKPEEKPVDKYADIPKADDEKPSYEMEKPKSKRMKGKLE